MVNRAGVSVSLKLKPNALSRVLGGHPWVFANECETLLPVEHDGEVVECRDRTGRFLGTGIYNGKSQIVWRQLSRERVALDAAYLRALTGLDGGPEWEISATRLVESDDLPGWWRTSAATRWSCSRRSRWRSGRLPSTCWPAVGRGEIIFLTQTSASWRVCP